MGGIKNRNGFTLIEIVTVIVILGVLSAAVASRYFDISASSLTSQTDVLKSHLRYAQSRSMNTNTVWGINISSTNQYSLFRDGNTTNTERLPGQDTITLTLPNGIVFSTTGIVSFDTWGKPFTNANATTAQSGTRVITLNYGASSQSINITQNTGYIP